MCYESQAIDKHRKMYIACGMYFKQVKRHDIYVQRKHPMSQGI